MRTLGVLALFAVAALSPPAWPADRAPLFAQLEQARRIVEGAQKPATVLYVFFDPNCYYCNLTWKALQPYEKAGLQVRWVPVAYQKESSAGMAAAMLLARDPAVALRENETRYKPKNYDGGIKPLSEVPPGIAKALEANMNLMRRFGAQGTPALVWKDAKGNIGFRNAVPRLSELPRITGLPEQQIEDPDLAEFR
jgi:thiol:disulfide interchange protein DsbG